MTKTVNAGKQRAAPGARGQAASRKPQAAPKAAGPSTSLRGTSAIKRNAAVKASAADAVAKVKPARGRVSKLARGDEQGVAKAPMKRPHSNRELREVSLDRIYHSALRLFVEQGYRSTTIDEIAAGAGLTKGGVYFYISKKEHLMAQMLDEIAARYITAIVAKLQKQDLTAQERLVSFMHSQVAFALTNPQEVMLLVMSSVEFSKSGGALTQKIDGIYDQMRKFVLSVVEQGLGSKSFKTNLRPAAAASFYVAAHDGMMLEWYRRGAEIDGTELVRVFREAFLRALT
jgi:AcrR family transcriptional regulator